MASPPSRWQRLVSWLLPWYDPEEQDRRLARSAAIDRELDSTVTTAKERLRQAYTDAGRRVSR